MTRFHGDSNTHGDSNIEHSPAESSTAGSPPPGDAAPAVAASDVGQGARVPAPIRIGRRDPSRLMFDWQDGVCNGATAAEVRRGCPCAHCIDEHTGRPLLDPASVPDHLTQTSVALVGNYAIAIVFSDGHRTGIFTWGNLRRIADASAHLSAPSKSDCDTDGDTDGDPEARPIGPGS